MECAYLSNDKNYTIFKYGPYTIRFKAPTHWNAILPSKNGTMVTW